MQRCRRTPGRSALLLLLLVVSGGCRAAADPACAVQQELCRGHGRDLFYAPHVALTPLESAPWYRCPLHWRAACPPRFRCAEPVRVIAGADQVLALPPASQP